MSDVERQADAAVDGGDEHPRVVGVRDVARRAGVSLGTVSNVLNSPDKVGERTRSRVESAISELGFVGSRAAGQLRSRRSGLVGVVVPDVGNPYWAAVLRGVESVLEDRDLALIVGSTRQSPQRQERLLHGLARQGVDGLLVAPIDAGRSWEGFADRHLGVVALDSDSGVGAGISLDNVDGAHQAVTHLLTMGHRSICFINGLGSVPWCAERRVGVLRGIREAGLDPDEVLIDVEVSDLTSAEGLRAADELWDSARPTAVLCANDLLALGVLLSAQRRGLDVPGDVSLVGYDDVEFVEALRPALTTVRQPSFEVGVVAAEMLLRGSGSRRMTGERALLSPQLVVRQSSGPAPRP
ncbi:LacI family DNA-binding transcriptional regulator [Microbacterium sp. KRD172]|uniref:LacI family DNA-binding transcriptional regulator n=1 Tax=Microbacterium sp. KRD172 TaxID=2729727 RepID=UPI0019D30425|nr:LacI family DNA-binding transcriptional regulator [Microbacterium sp. KRD172]